MRFKFWIALAAAGFTTACIHRPPRPDAATSAAETAAKSPTVSILTYNVENLFDTEDDPVKNDETFLPASVKADPVFQNRCRTQNSNPFYARECLSKDWSPRILDRKLSRLSDVIAQVQNGRGPDILMVEEVESHKVLEQWRDRYMSAMGYTTLAYVKGPDERGINTAVFSRLPLLEPPRLHEIDFSSLEKNPRPSRGILEVHLRLPNGDPLVVLSLHFPSQGAPTAFRKLAVDKLLAIAAGFPKGTNILVGGDFNITAKEEWKEKYVENRLAKEFTVSHYVGCKGCVGTIYYSRDNTWSFFDILLFSKSLSSGGTSPWRLDPASIHIVNSSVYQINRYGKPARFGNGRGPVGVSDHWPMYAELKLTGVQQ